MRRMTLALRVLGRSETNRIAFGASGYTLSLRAEPMLLDEQRLPTARDLDAAAPKAKTMAVIKDFVMVGDTNDGTDGDQPNRVWWPAINDPTNWPTPGSSSAAQVQSDYQNLPGTGRVQKVAPAIGGADGAVFCERGI